MPEMTVEEDNMNHRSGAGARPPDGGGGGAVGPLPVRGFFVTTATWSWPRFAMSCEAFFGWVWVLNFADARNLS